MNYKEVEILLVEENMEDAELTIHTGKKINLANRLFRVKDSAEALDFLFPNGEYAGRSLTKPNSCIKFLIELPLGP